MNYQKIKIEKNELFIDSDKRGSKCKLCKKIIYFAINHNSNLVPVTKIENTYDYHTEYCKEDISFSKQTEEELNQNDLSEL